MNVKFFKLNNGEEFVADAIEEYDDGYVIEEPMVLVNSGQGAAFYPWMLVAKERTMDIRKSDLLFGRGLEPESGSVSDYGSAKEHFTKIRLQRETGIVTPDQQSLILG